MNASTFLRVMAALLLISLSPVAWSAAEIVVEPLETAEDVYAVAVGHYSASRWEQADDAFARFLREFPDHSQAALALFFHAEVLVQQGRHADARNGFLEFVKREPKHRFVPQARFRAAEARYLAGETEAARAELEQFLADHPGSELNAHVRKYLAELALAARDGQRAAELFQEVLRTDPDGLLVDECRFGLGRAMEMQGDIEAARIAYQTLAAANGPLADDAQVQLGVCLYNHARYVPAITAFQAAIERFPDSNLVGHARYWLGMCYVAQQDWGRAAEALQSALDRHPQHPLSPAMTFWLADALRQDGDALAANAGYAKVVRDWPDCEWADDSLYLQIQLALADLQYGRVILLGEQFRVQYPASPFTDEVLPYLGRAHLKQEQYAQAIGILAPLVEDRLATASPADPDAASEHATSEADREAADQRRTNHYYLGLAHLGSHQYEAALASLAKIQETLEDQPDLRGGVLLAQAMALAGLDRLAEAIEPLRQYLAAQPEGPEAAACRSQLVEALLQCGRLDEAIRTHAQMPLEGRQQPGFAALTQRLAEAAFSAEKNDAAAELFSMLTQDGQPPEWASKGWSGLGWTYFRIGQDQAATDAFGELLERYPESPLAAEGAVMRAKAFEQLERRQDALEAYLVVATTYIDSQYAAAAMMSAAKLQEELGRKAEVIPLLRRLIDEHPEFEQLDAALYQLAWLLDEQDQAGEAEQVFERISDKYPHTEYWADSTYRLAERATRAGQYDRAKRFADLLIEAECDKDILVHTLYLRGQLAASTQRWQEVAAPLSALLEQFPDSPLRTVAACWIAESHYQQRDYETAARWFEDLRDAPLADGDAWSAMISLRRSQILAERQQWQEAHDLAEGIEERFPGFGQQYEADYVLALCLARLDQPTEALDRFERVIRSPEGGRTKTAAKAQFMIGEIHAARIDLNQALKAYYRVESLYDYPQWKAAALVQAGKCHELRREHDEAARAWSQVVANFAQTPAAKEAAQRLEQLKTRLAASPSGTVVPAAKVSPPETAAPAAKVSPPARGTTGPSPGIVSPAPPPSLPRSARRRTLGER